MILGCLVLLSAGNLLFDLPDLISHSHYLLLYLNTILNMKALDLSKVIFKAILGNPAKRLILRVIEEALRSRRSKKSLFDSEK